MSYKLPDNFLWGAATSAHQVEGGNWNADWWEFEHRPDAPIAEPSGDACNQYHLYAQDIALMRDLGYNAYRFGVEWARIEPEEGEFSRAALDHYADVCQTCKDHGIEPVITLVHCSLPRWVSRKGGWLWDGLPEKFDRYARVAAEHLKEYMGWVVTINEPDLTTNIGIRHGMFPRLDDLPLQGNEAAEQAAKVIFDAHKAARTAIKKAAPEAKVGLTLAIAEWGGGHTEEELQQFVMVQHWEGPFWALTKGDDFIGVQSYTRLFPTHAYTGELLGGPGLGIMYSGYPEGTRGTPMGYEYRPQSLGASLRRAYEKTGLPMLVTENGVPADDDTLRVEYIRGAMAELRACLDEGLPIHGYLHWSLLDNFEWNQGYNMHFGLIAVDLETFERTPKPSAHYLGEIAKKNTLP